MNGIKKQLGLGVVSILMTASLVGCSGSGGNPGEPAPSAAATAPVKNGSSDTVPAYYSKEPRTITMFTSSAQSWPYKEDWAAWNWVKEKTNITVKGVIPTGNSNEALALNIASKDLQDVITTSSVSANKYGAEGAFLDLSKHLNQMPNFKVFLDKNPQLKTRVTGPNGEIFHALIDGAGITNQMIWFYREDIFQKHNLKPPATWDELYTVSKELKKLYPDSYPFVYRHGLDNLMNFGPSFETYPKYYPEPKTNKVKYGPIEDSFNQMIAHLNKFYKEGLIPPDWLSLDAKAWTQMMVTNKAFISIQYIGQMEIINNQLKEGRLQFLPPPAGPTGKQYNPDTNYEVSGLAVNSESKNREAALKYIDFLYSREGTDIMSWGKENETYTVVNGKRKFKDEYKQFTDLRKNLGIMTSGSYGKFDTNAMISMINEKERYAYEEAPKYAFPVQIVSPNWKPDELEQLSRINAPIEKHFSENMAKFILGSRPLSEWSKYVDEVKKLKVDEMIELHQKAWDRQRGK